MSGRISGRVVWSRMSNAGHSKSRYLKLLTVLHTASNAAPIASVTVTFLSLSLSNIGGTTLSRYLANVPIIPLARFSRQPAATMTQLMFASLCMQCASDLVSSPSSGASLMRGVAVSNVSSSSRASFLSFHLEEPNDACKLAGNLGTILTSSANARGSGGTSSALRYHSSGQNTTRVELAFLICNHRLVSSIRFPGLGFSRSRPC